MWDFKEVIDGFDSLHGEKLAKIHQEIYENSGTGMYSSPGMHGLLSRIPRWSAKKGSSKSSRKSVNIPWL